VSRSLPTPVEVAVADKLAVRDLGAVFTLSLWSEGADNAGVTQLVMPVDAVAGHLWESTRSFHAGVRELADRARFPVPDVARASAPNHAARVYWGNFFLIYRHGLECALDCYYLSPRDIHLATTSEAGLRPLPVLAIRTVVPALLGLLDFVDSAHPSAVERLQAVTRATSARD
jgi:hypothetical protein